MSNAAAKLLSEYESLAPAEKQEFVQELMRRSSIIDLQERGIDEAQAADLRARLKTFAEDWDRPEAAIYDEDPTR
jgi:hypothetical protein